MRKDADGEFWHIVAGAFIGAGVELAGQLISGKNMSEVKWTAVGVSAAAGAVSAAAGPVAGMIAFGAGSGVADYINNKDMKSAVTAGVVGGIASKVGGAKATIFVTGQIKKPSAKLIKSLFTTKKTNIKTFFTATGFKSWSTKHFSIRKTSRYFKSRSKSTLSAWFSGNYQTVYNGVKRK